MKAILLILLATASLCSEPKIKIVANFPVHPAPFTQMLHLNGIEVTAETSDLWEYCPDLVRDRSRWGKLLKKFHLDFPKHVDIGEDVKKIIFYNATVRHWRNLSLQKLPKDKLILFMWEPPNVLKRMYSKTFHAKFGRIYTWDDTLVDNIRYFKFNYPSLQPMISEVVPFEEKKLCTLVGTNITPKYPSSLYGERVKAIEFFEKIGEEGFEFYGKKWDSSRFKSYRGAIENKTDAVKNYRFSICYENSQGQYGYITEKIFDCFAAGNVPIYWGAPNITDYIPKECFIDRRDFNTLEDLYAFIKNMNKESYEQYLTNIRTYLQSEKAKEFSPEKFMQIFCDAVRSENQDAVTQTPTP